MVTSQSKAEVPRPLFIIGCYRSGTSLLRLMLTSHPAIFIPEETRYIPYIFSRLSEYGGIEKIYNLEMLLKDINKFLHAQKWHAVPNLNYLTSALSNFHYSEIVKAVNLFPCPEQKKQNLVYWGDKTPSYVGAIAFLNKIFPEAHFINIIRDGRDVCASSLKLHVGGARTVAAAALEWKERILDGFAGEKIVGYKRYKTIKYEDLVNSPAKILGNICEFLDIPYDDIMLSYPTSGEARILSKQGHHKNVLSGVNKCSVASYKRKLTPKQIQRFERCCFNVLIGLGYEPSSPYIPQEGNITRYTQLGVNMIKLTWSRTVRLFASKFHC